MLSHNKVIDVITVDKEPEKAKATIEKLAKVGTFHQNNVSADN
jgi:hypothetical protein